MTWAISSAEFGQQHLGANFAGGRGQGDERFQACVEAEEDAVAVGAAICRHTIEQAFRAFGEVLRRVATVGVVEVVEDAKRTRERDFENGSAAGAAGLDGHAIKIAVRTQC